MAHVLVDCGLKCTKARSRESIHSKHVGPLSCEAAGTLRMCGNLPTLPASILPDISSPQEATLQACRRCWGLGLLRGRGHEGAKTC